MYITIFESKDTNGKAPLSPYDDNSFDFKTLSLDSANDMFRIMATNFILNLPLTKDIHSKRRKTDLQSYYQNKFDYIVLDIDKITSKENQIKILKYFKHYKCILGDSRSTNNIDNFNLKGFLFIEPLSLENVKVCIEQIHDDLIEFGDVDIAVARIPSLNAPMKKFNVLLNSENKLYKFIYKPKYKSKELQEILNNKFEIPKNFKFDHVDTIDQLCLQVFVSMGFQAIKSNGNCIVFKHPSETKTPGGYFWFKDNPYIMHHYNETKNVNIFSEISKFPEAKELLKKDIDYNDKLLNFNISTNVITINEQFITLSKEIKNSINSFLNGNDGLFAIRSPMGTGKSAIISKIIQEAQELDLRVLICTNRISVANDFSLKYNLKLYNKDKYSNNDSMIVQYDSLWRYNIKNFDLVVLDEFISLLLHARNNLNNTCQNIAKFFGCFNKKLVIADAFLTGYENFLLNGKKENLWLINNEYRDNTQLYNYDDYNCFIQSVLKHARKHKITVSCTSLNVLQALKLLFEKYNIKVITLTAETPNVTKELIYKLFENEENDKFDVLLYSPTLTVGVSNMNNVDYHFHYDSSASCDVISSIQMIKRTRKAKEIHLYIKNRINYVKTSYKEIKEDYLQNLGKSIEHNYLFELNDYGEPRLSKIGKKAIQIDLFKNILEFNHKNAFLFLMKYHFKNSPINIDKKYSTNILLPYINEVKQSAEEFKMQCLNDYMTLSNLDRNLMIDLSKQNLFEILENLEHKLLECDKKTKTKIFKLELKTNKFIDTVIKYKTLKKYFNKELEKSDIQNLISKSMMVNSDDVKYWNLVLNFESEILDSYLPGQVNNNSKLKTIIKGCGYTLQNINGIKQYCISKDILEFKDFIKD